MAILLLLALAVAPGVAISVYVYHMDKVEKEPLSLLVKCFFLGVLSSIPALMLELWADQLGLAHPRNAMAVWVQTFLVIAVSEEGSKFAVLRWYAFPKKDFNEPFDGIIYSVMVSMGFATIENIMYVLQGGWAVGVARLFMAVPGHATFAVIMGYFVGVSKFRQTRVTLEISGLVGAIAFHGAYDFFLMVRDYRLLAVGAFVALGLGIRLSLKAMKDSENLSPFLKGT